MLYKLPFFVKNIPVNDRPAYILRQVSGSGRVLATDYSSYEASFTPLYCLSIEYEVYRYFGNGMIAHYICKAFYLFNTSIFMAFRVHILAKRMSGDVNTSLGNGVSNLITIQYIVFTKTKVLFSEIVIEGDDSLFNLPLGVNLTPADFALFGLKVKIEESHYPNLASFCGNIFDIEDLDVLVDPGRIFRRFGFIDTKYKNARKSIKLGLLRAYAFSIYYMYHGCPMVAELAKYLLRVTRGVHANMKAVNVYRLAEGEKIPASESKMFQLYPEYIGEGSRKIISLLYGYSRDEQLRVESYIASLNSLQPLIVPEVVTKSHPDTRRYHEECVVNEGEELSCLKWFPPPPVSFREIVDTVNFNVKFATTMPWVHEAVEGAPVLYPDLDVFSGLRHRLAMA